MDVIVNATNIGHQLSGISVYSLNLLREFVNIETDIHFLVFLNRNGVEHLKDVRFAENFKIQWVTSWISPDYQFQGHFLRLLHSNLMGLRTKKSLVFNTSPLEAIFFQSNQVITVHDVIPLLFGQDHRKQYYYYKYFLKYVLKRAKAVITGSNHTKRLIEGLYELPGDKIHVIYDGIQDIYLRQGETCSPHRENFILYAGRLTATKNVQGLLRAFELVKERISHSLVIAGNGKGKDSFPSMERVLFKGYVSSRDLVDLYRRASLFVFPSFYEGFGLPPLEAMACGCPVVVSKVASLPEVCGDAAYYVNPYNVESIAEGMYRVATDQGLREGMIEKGFQRVKQFSWEKSAKEHLKVFEKILSS